MGKKEKGHKRALLAIRKAKNVKPKTRPVRPLVSVRGYRGSK